MHFFDFLQLAEDDQLETLWYNGEQIGRRKETGFLILLYQVEGFYVEVFYNTKEKQITKYVSFECLDKLDPYIENMDISVVYRYMKKRPGKKEGNEVINGRMMVTPGEDPLRNFTMIKQKNHPGILGRILSWLKNK